MQTPPADGRNGRDACAAVRPQAFMQRHATAWQLCWSALGVTPEPALLRQIVAAYAEPHRHYHTLQHLDACLQVLGTARQLASRIAEVELALWFHDLVYLVPATDNEQASADRARDALLGAGAAMQVAQSVHAMVMMTCHAQEPTTGDQALMLDVDLSILGAAPQRFEQYEQQVRQEYAQVPELQFRARRRTMLQQFLARPRIYRTDFFRDRLEARARANLQASIDLLGAGPIS